MGFDWKNLETMNAKRYKCGYCGENVASEKGYYSTYNKIYICPLCSKPTYFNSVGVQVPGYTYGILVNNINSEEVKNLYGQARNCMTVGAYTAAVLCCRKLLMNIAVSLGANEGINFIQYVEYLSDKGFIPPNGKAWVDKIRTKGNEATHEIAIMNENDAKLLLDFLGMLMKFIYEFPAMVAESK